jgi:hypothetical protein
MKPMGQRPIRFPSKTDCHPPKGFVNWWENVHDRRDRVRSAKRQMKLQTEKEAKEISEE